MIERPIGWYFKQSYFPAHPIANKSGIIAEYIPKILIWKSGVASYINITDVHNIMVFYVYLDLIFHWLEVQHFVLFHIQEFLSLNMSLLAQFYDIHGKVTNHTE